MCIFAIEYNTYCKFKKTNNMTVLIFLLNDEMPFEKAHQIAAENGIQITKRSFQVFQSLMNQVKKKIIIELCNPN